MKKCVRNVVGCMKMMTRVNRQVGLVVIMTVEGGIIIGVLVLLVSQEVVPNFCVSTALTVRHA